MIRHFDRTDLRRIKKNEFSNPADIDFVFDDPTFFKNTLVMDNQEIGAIMLFKSYWQNCFLVFLLISEDMTPIYARELKQFLDDARIDFNADRVQTESVSTPVLRKWHEFLGFRLEGCREKMIYNKDYDQWGMNKGRDF